METLQSIFPMAEDLLSTPIEDLAPVLLRLASTRLQGAGFIPESVTQITIGSGMIATQDNGYPFHTKAQVDALLSRVWNWIERNGYIEPSPGLNERNGWRLLTDEGAAIAAGQDIRQLMAAKEFPKSLLHPSIRDKVWAALRRNDLDEAVRSAFVALEDVVREAGRFSNTESI